MPDFSFAELLVVVVVAVVFIGPKDLPVVIRALARAMRALKNLGKQAQQLFDELAKEVGVADVKDTLEKDIMLIKGDDGQLYEAYDINKVLPKADEKKDAI